MNRCVPTGELSQSLARILNSHLLCKNNAVCLIWSEDTPQYLVREPQLYEPALLSLGIKTLVSPEKTGYKTGGFGSSSTFSSSGNFKIPLQTPTITVTAIKRIWPCCALLQTHKCPPPPHTVLWIQHNSTHTKHSLIGDFRLCGPHG